MPTVHDLRARLIDKLKELFQLNQPDLDFGFYRIMHAKAEQVTRFLETNLPAIIKAALGDTDEARRQELLNAWNTERQKALGYGAPDPDASPLVKEARARYDAAADTLSLERQIYDHLYRFFERYYEEGDFVSRRYYVRESDSRAAPYAVPYSGEEVKLVWANMDQYYIKTAEHFTNFTVDLAKATFVEMRGGGGGQIKKNCLPPARWMPQPPMMPAARRANPGASTL